MSGEFDDMVRVLHAVKWRKGGMSHADMVLRLKVLRKLRYAKPYGCERNGPYAFTRTHFLSIATDIGVQAPRGARRLYAR